MSDVTAQMLLVAALSLSAVTAGLAWLLLRRPAPRDVGPELAAGVAALQQQLAQQSQQTQRIAEQNERLERELRAAITQSAAHTRQDWAQALALLQQTLLQQSAEATRSQNQQLDALAQQLAALQKSVSESLAAQVQAMTEANAKRLAEMREGMQTQLTQMQHSNAAQLTEMRQTVDAQWQATLQQNAEAARTQNQRLDAVAQQLTLLQKGLGDSLAQHVQAMSEANARRLGEMRATIETQLAQLQQGNATKLDEMRQTVDEKLQATLQTRLGESFRQVAERLELVHKGLGEMHTLAQGVGDLKHLLTNVKTRGMFGEAQLGALLEEVLSPEQYAAQVATRPGEKGRVDFAVRLPGRSDSGEPVWLPIDAKFPNEDYERLLDAQGRADAAGAEAAGRALEARIRLEAKSMAEKYVEPPHTTDFAILFLPTEGLYAEVLRRPGLMALLQREHRVTLAGPTTLLAMLNALQMGFRTLALEKRSSEVWQVLGAVKTEFGKFGDVLGKVRNQTQKVLNTLDQAQTRTHVLTRKLRGIEALPEAQTRSLLGAASLGIDADIDTDAEADVDEDADAGAGADVDDDRERAA